MGISALTYRDWEYEKKITGEPYVKLAMALNVSITELFTENNDFVLKIQKNLNELERVVENIRKTVSSL